MIKLPDIKKYLILHKYAKRMTAEKAKPLEERYKKVLDGETQRELGDETFRKLNQLCS